MAPSWVPSLPFGKQKEDCNNKEHRSLSKKQSFANFSLRRNKFSFEEEDREQYENQHLPEINTGTNFAADLTFCNGYMMSTPIVPNELASELGGAPLAAVTISSPALALDDHGTGSSLKAALAVEKKTVGSTLKAKVTQMVAFGHHGRGDAINAIASTTNRSAIVKPESICSNKDKNSSASSEASMSGGLEHVLRTNKGDVYGKASQRGLNIAHQLARHRRNKRNITPRTEHSIASGISIRRSVSQSTGPASNVRDESSTSSRRHSAINMPADTVDPSFKSIASIESRSSMSTGPFPSFHQSLADEYASNGSIYSQHQQGSERDEHVLDRVDEEAFSDGHFTEFNSAEAPKLERTVMDKPNLEVPTLETPAKSDPDKTEGIKLLHGLTEVHSDIPANATHITAEQIKDALNAGNIEAISGQELRSIVPRPLSPNNDDLEFIGKDLHRYLLAVACYSSLIEDHPQSAVYKEGKMLLVAHKNTKKGRFLANEGLISMTLQNALATIKALRSTIAEKETYIQDCHNRFDDDESMIERLTEERKNFEKEGLAANIQAVLGQNKIEELENGIKMVTRDGDSDGRANSNTVIRLERENKAIKDKIEKVRLQLESAENEARDAQETLASLKVHILSYKKKCDHEQKKYEASAAAYRSTCDEQVESHKKRCEMALKKKTEKHNAQLDLLEADHARKLDDYKKDCEVTIATEKAWAVTEVKKIEDKKDATLEAFEKECNEALAKERENSLAAIRRTDAKQSEFFKTLKEDHKMQLEQEQEKIAVVSKELKTKRKQALETKKALELKLEEARGELSVTHKLLLRQKDHNDAIQKENEDTRENYDYYRSYFLAQQAVYRQHNFGNWDEGTQERIEATGGVYVRPEGMPLRNSEMEEYGDFYEDSVEIFEGEAVQIVSILAHNLSDNEGGSSSSSGSASGSARVDA